VPLYFELDGTFPNHEANPLDPKNLVDLQHAVPAHGADLGLAFDGDADRCFFIDERGAVVSPSAVTSLVATREIAKEKADGRPGTVIHNLITSRTVPDVIAEEGGVAVRTRVGHAFIKVEMAQRNAVFGGEHSAHYYFRDFWFADTGMLAALHVLAALGEGDRPLSELAHRYERYPASGEINSTVASTQESIALVEAEFSGRAGVELDHLDGLTVTHAGTAADPDDPMWWFNLRPSNTEPLLRLNAEAADPATMARIRDEVLSIVRADARMSP
jgi:phosphomannomutase